MTREQIEQAAGDYLDRENLEINHEEDNYAAGVYDGFIAGANSRQPEIDELSRRVAHWHTEYTNAQRRIDLLRVDCKRYKQDIADGLKREEIARKVIEEKRKEK